MKDHQANAIHWIVVAVAMAVSIAAVIRKWEFVVSLAVVVLLVIWLVLILLSSAYRARFADTSKAEDEPKTVLPMPTRAAAILLPLAFMIIATAGFANMYQQRTNEKTHTGIFEADSAVKNPTAFVHFSVATITTVGYGDLKPMGTEIRWLAIAEVATGLLILACAFPLMLARISKW